MEIFRFAKNYIEETMNKINYQLILDKEITAIKALANKPTLLLQACCAPCSSYVLEYLSSIFDITIFFYNPNISPEKEYLFRLDELNRLIGEMLLGGEVKVIGADYEPQLFYAMAKGMEDLPEGGERCFKCYELRLRKTAAAAKSGGYDYFSTTLSISPHKNAQKLNEIGGTLSEEFGVRYLFSDFKKRGGYKRSCELSEQYSLYRQDYCGCVYSKAEAEKRRNERDA